MSINHCRNCPIASLNAPLHNACLGYLAYLMIFIPAVNYSLMGIHFRCLRVLIKYSFEIIIAERDKASNESAKVYEIISQVPGRAALTSTAVTIFPLALLSFSIIFGAQTRTLKGIARPFIHHILLRFFLSTRLVFAQLELFVE